MKTKEEPGRISLPFRAPFHSHPLLRLACQAVCTAWCCCLAAQAGSLSWSGGATTAYWNDSANWGFAGTPTNGDVLIFPAGQPKQTNTNNISGLTLNQIRFAGGGGGYVLLGNSFTLTNGILATNTAGANALSNNIVLATSDSTVTVSNSLTLAGVLSGSAGLVKDGAGTLTLAGSSGNTYTGPTAVSNGVLQLAKTGGNAIQFASLTIAGLGQVKAMADDQVGAIPVTLIGFATFDLNGFNDTLGTNLNFAGSAALGFLGNLKFPGGTLSLQSNSLIQCLNGDASLWETSLFEGDNLNLSGACALYVDESQASMNMSCSISGAASITKTGLGNVSLKNSNSYSGLTVVSAGYVSADNSYSLGTTSSGTVVSNGGTLRLNGVAITNEPLTLYGMGDSNYYAGIAMGSFSGSGDTTNMWSGPVTLGSDTLILSFGSTNTELKISGVISGSGNLTIGSASVPADSQGRIVFGGSTANTYTGTTVVNSGTLELSKTGGNAIQYGSLAISNATVRAMASDQVGSVAVTVGDGGLFDLNGFSDTLGTNLTLGNFSTVDLGGGSLSLLNNSTITSRLGKIENGSLNLHAGSCIIDAANTLVLDCSVLGTASITKAGSGELDLGQTLYASTNSYSGELVIAAGTVQVRDSHALGSTNGGTVVRNGASLIIPGGAFSTTLNFTNEPLALNGHAGNTANASGALVAQGNGTTNIWAGPVTLASDSTLQAEDNHVCRILGPVGGAGGLNVGLTNHSDYSAGGTFLLEGASPNNYSGTTIVYSGTLLLSKSIANAALGGPLIVGSGVQPATVRLALNAQFPDILPVTVNSNAVLDMNNISDTFGSLSGSGSIMLGSGSIGPNADDGNSTFAGIISGTGGLNKHGTGTLTLTATNTYTGTNEVVNGMLVIDGYQPQSPVLVDAVGKFSGSGTVGAINCAGRLFPGAGIGTLTCSNLTFTGTGSLFTELAGPVPGVSYDQLKVRGTVTLANAALHVIPTFTSPTRIGQTFTIIANDGAEAVSGTFGGLPEGASFNTAGCAFTITYTGGTGNDVKLTLTDVPAAVVRGIVLAGNGNHAIDPNECNNLWLVITNQSGFAMTNINTTLSSTTPGVLVTQPYSACADIPAGGNGTNTDAFQLSILPNFTCGSDINLQLAITSSDGAFVVPFALHSGEPAPLPIRYDYSTVTPIPDVGAVDTTNTVGGFTGPLEKVTVSLWLQHPLDADLDLSLISPDGISVPLASRIGSGSNFGTNCAPDIGRTTFDDLVPVSITNAFPPFLGVFKPQGSLAGFNNGTANGNWRLRVTDYRPGSLGNLRCWSLFLYPVACATNSNPCGFCSAPIINSITGADTLETGRATTNGVMASCGAPKLWPGMVAGNYHHDLYTFTNNTGADACVTVLLNSPCDLQAVVYLGSFNPLLINLNYLGDSGGSTINGPQSCSVSIPAGDTFYVIVNETSPGAGCPNYVLQLSGLPCPPPVVNIQPVSPNQARLYWPTWAGGYQLQSSPALALPAWSSVSNEPVVLGNDYNVTNSSINPSNRFYRLQKP